MALCLNVKIWNLQSISLNICPENLDLRWFNCTSQLDKTCFSIMDLCSCSCPPRSLHGSFECYRLRQQHLTQLHLLATLAGSGAPRSASSSLKADCWVHYVLKMGSKRENVTCKLCKSVVKYSRGHKNSSQHLHVLVSLKKLQIALPWSHNLL